MKRPALFLLVLLTATLAQSRPALQTPQTRELLETWLEGTVGTAAVRVFVERAGWPKSEGLWGMYYYTRYWGPIPLDGDWTSAAGIRMFEGDPSAADRARLDLRLTDAGADGTWTSADGRELPVHLRRVAQPASFDVAIQRPRRFADPRWPIEFTYPDGWFLQVGGTELILRSPDPQDMLWGNELRCERGRGLPAADQERGGPFQGSFYRTRDGWRVEETTLVHVELSLPRTRAAGAMTFMSADTAYRAHGAWGYAGIGEGREYLAVEGEEWVHCYDRLLDSEDRIEPRRG